MTKQRSKASLLGIALFLIATTLAAQVTEEWVARYDGPASGWDRAISMAIDGAGNVYITGYSEGSGIGDYDYATVKYNSSGVEQWVARYDGPGNDYDIAASLAVDDAGNVYVTGWSYGSGTYEDYATVKYSSSGVQQWAAQYNGPGNGDDIAISLAVDGAGNVYVTGYSYGLGTEADYATVKYNPSGTEQWVARYDGPTSEGDVANAIAIDGAGNVYVTGYSYGSGTDNDYATVKYSSAGTEQWVARYDGPINTYDNACAIAVDDAGNVYVTGYSYGSGTFEDYATIKYNSSGIEEWVARYDGPASIYDWAYAMVVDDAGNVYVTGCSDFYIDPFVGDYATIKYNSSGVEQWVARYDGSASDWDAASAIAVDDAGNVYVTGGGGGEYATVKYNSSGVKQWVARYDGLGNGNDKAQDIALDDSGNVYVTGYSKGSGIEDYDYATVKYSQGPGVAEASPDVPGHRLEVTQLAPEPVITYTLSSSSSISLKVYDVTGKLVETLVSGSQDAGTHTITWDGKDDAGEPLSAGVYFLRFQSESCAQTVRLVMVR